MTLITGYLKDGTGQPVTECSIILQALKTSSEVIKKISSCTTTKDGYYSIDAQTGRYEVVILRDGNPPASVGIIDVYADSLDGSLNDFLLNPNESEVTPEILAQVTALRDDSKKFAAIAEDTAKNILVIDSSVTSIALDVKQSAQEASDAATLAQQAKEGADASLKSANDSEAAAQQAAQGITDQITTIKTLADEVENSAKQAATAEKNTSLSAENAKHSEQEAGKFAQQAEQSASQIDLSNTLKLTGGTLTGDLFINDKKVLVDGDADKFVGGTVTGDTNFTGKLQASTIDVAKSINIGQTNLTNTGANLFINDKKVLVDGDVSKFNGGTIDGDTNFTGKLQASTVDVAKSVSIGASMLTNVNDSLFINGKEVLVNGSSFKHKGSLGRTELNTLTGDLDGVYIQYGEPSSNLNYPVLEAGSLVVLNTGGWLKSCVQIYNTYLGIEYRRNYNANTNMWSGWSKVDYKNLVDNKSCLGINQSWQDVTKNRFNNVVYTNTTGAPIQVAITAPWGNEANVIELWSQNVMLGRLSQQQQWIHVSTITGIIPNRASYCVGWSKIPPIAWSELR